MLWGLVCVRRCMWVKLTHRKTGLPAAFCRFRKSTERSAKSSSQVSIRFLVRGPVSLMVCLPTLPKRGSTVGSSLSLALQSRTPRGPKFAKQFGFLGGVEVVERAVELVEAVHGRQMLIAVAEVVLAELGGGVPLGLEQL